MSEQTPPNSPKKESVAANPQIIAAGITAIATILVALISVLPNILPKDTPTATSVVIMVTPTAATASPQSTTAAPPSPTVSEASATDVPPPSATSVPATPVSTETDTSVAVAPSTPVQTPNLLLMYDEVSFTVLNQSAGVLSLEGVVFRSSAGEWDAAGWGTSLYNSLPAGMCLRLRDASVGQRQPPQPCVNHIYGLIETQGSTLFWLGVEQFDVVRAGTTLATCAVTAQSCAIYVP